MLLGPFLVGQSVAPVLRTAQGKYSLVWTPDVAPTGQQKPWAYYWSAPLGTGLPNVVDDGQIAVRGDPTA